MRKTTKCAFQYWLDEQASPDQFSKWRDPYMARGGERKRFGAYFRDAYRKQFDESYRKFWLTHPEFWPTETTGEAQPAGV